MTLRPLFALATILATLACGGSPTAPSPPQPTIPQVAGTYIGTVTVTLPEVQASRTCPATTAVTQSGSTVSIAPIVFGGACGNLSVPVGQGTMETTGNLVGSNSGTFFEPTCGGSYTYTASAGFFGRELRISMNATSAVCLNINFTAVLTR